MNKHVVLKRRIAIQGWRVIGCISKAGKRKELEPILERARETGGTNAEDVAKHLFSNRPARSSRRDFSASGPHTNSWKGIAENIR